MYMFLEKKLTYKIAYSKLKINTQLNKLLNGSFEKLDGKKIVIINL